MKRLLAILILLTAVSATQASSAMDPGDSPDTPWSVNPKVRNDFSSHTSYEFGNPFPPYQAPLSRLEFPLDSWWAGLEARRSFSRVSVGIEAMRNISGAADGPFKDSDWDDDARPGVKTIYSESNLRLDPSYSVRADVDLKISDWVGLPSGFDLRPVIGGRWQRFSFVSHDGLQVYPSPGDTTPPIALPGDGIRFEQTYWQTFLGVKTAYEWRNPVYVSRLGVRMQLDWAYVIGENEDHHMLREGRRFTYEETRGNGWHAALGLDVGLTRQLSANLDLDYLKLDTSGSHRWVNTVFGEDESSGYEVNVWSQQFGITMGLKYAF
ncbi:MAG: omptin family outer membrane protease [Methylobacter tundripaludum]|uniref:Omptin family protein n=1 Tax=Methylobacter tundripaludum TaxID=173365 RepID=A0A2S6GST0_9GAMM|nr:omptin family outer membrane protease [Methylobacter tundripaludum]MCF7965272.1 omptin family outer membrane protease [Methylobacter tundripaludum]MCK9636516.1 omptin family outer membrane protease [Methylobacter tundripaludum]PPK68233.1 omptin family protein [Methylobacter tundripaludum]